VYQSVDPDEVAFDSSVFLLTQRKSQKSDTIDSTASSRAWSCAESDRTGREPEPTPPASAKATPGFPGPYRPRSQGRHESATEAQVEGPHVGVELLSRLTPPRAECRARANK
jgi:hypothetical protein